MLVFSLRAMMWMMQHRHTISHHRCRGPVLPGLAGERLLAGA
jgi:hypothetical protein